MSKPAAMLQREIVRLLKGILTAWEKFIDASEGIERTPKHLNR